MWLSKIKYSDLTAWIILLVFNAIASILFWDFFFPSAANGISGTNNGNSFIGHFLVDPYFASVILFFVLPFVLKFQTLRWANISFNKILRLVFTFCALIICWILVGEKYNFYLNSWFLIDRIALLLLCVLISLHPVFIPLFSSAALLFYSQYFTPFNWLYNYDIRPLFAILLIGNSLIFVDHFGIKVKHILTLFFLVQLSSYFYTAVAKFNISPHGFNWVTDNELFLLPLNAHLRGWLKPLGQNIYRPLTWIFVHFGVLISAIILGFEAICVFGLSNRKLIIGLLISAIVIHVGIAIICGISFWVWVLLNLLLLYILFSHPELPVWLSGKYRGLKSIVLVSLGILIFQPIAIGWFDSRYQWYTEFEVKAENGKTYSFNKNDFGGYSYLFVHDALTNALPAKLPGFNGYSAMWQEAMLYKGVNENNVDSLRNLTGKCYYDSIQAQKLNIFLTLYFNNYNKRIEKKNGVAILSAPKQLCMFDPDLPPLPAGKRVSEISIWLKEYIYTTDGYHDLGKRKMVQIEL